MGIDRQFGVGAKLHMISNGFDPEELKDVKPRDFGHFAIVYAGSFYPPKRVILPIMAALKYLEEIMDGKRGEWYFHYFGGHEDHVSEEAKRVGVIERVVLHGNVRRAEILSAVRGANVAVVITSVAEESTIEDKGIVPGKVFESLGLGTPILLIAPPESDVATIIETTGLGQRFAGSDVRGITSFLVEAMSGRVPRPRDCEAYTWANIAKRMDIALRAVLGTVSQNQWIS
jgi:glycosyltransferase involved in cell wall biosynthesis